MSDGYIQIAPDGTGKKVDNAFLTVNAEQVYRQRVEVYPGTTLPVSGPVTDAELRATALPVSGPATDAQLRATALPVSGPVTDAQLRATALPVSGSLGAGALTLDAWGIQKISFPHSLFHGLWTFDIPASMWFMFENGTQVYSSTNIVSGNGAAVMTTSATKTALVMESRECPRYQPNRGHLFSTALWCPSKTANGVREWGMITAENSVKFRLKADGLLYAILKSGGVETKEELIDTSAIAGFDVQKGNVYDIQYQWRGVGNYKFFINLQLVHTFANLGTLTALSMQNPALPASFKCTRTTQDVSMSIGCCDVTSENGENDQEEYGASFAAGVSTTGADKPVMVLFNPLQINGVTNTRTVSISVFSVINSKKSTFKVWRTRTLSNITGATFQTIGGGSWIQTDSPDMTSGAVRATAATVANMRFITAIPVESAVARIVETPNPMVIKFNLVRGDYLVITSDATAGSSDVVVKWGEQI